MLVGHVLSHPTALARGGGDCIHANKVYTSTTRIEGGRIVGCQRGVGDGGAQLATATGTFFQNVVNWHGGNGLIADQGLRLENLTHAPLGTFPKRYIEFGFADLFWQPGQPTAFWLTSSVRPDYLVINHNGDGKTYRLFERQQLTDAPLWPAEAGQPWASPEPGLTMGQSYAKYGIAWRDTVLDPAQAVPLEGLTVGFAAPVASLPPSPARCPVTFPSREGPAIVQNGRVLIYALLTGDPSGASTRCRFQVDDLPPIVVDAGSFPADRRFVTTAVSPGTHVVKSWRLDSRNRPIPASTLTQCYYVDRPSGVCPEGGPPLPSTSARPATPSTPRGSRRP
jgi:hypothetical protein